MCPDESRQHEAIEKLTKQTLTPQSVDGFWPSWLPRPKPAREPSSASPSMPALSAGKSEGLKQARPGRRSRKAKREIPALLLPPRYKVEIIR
ncbi:Uncharacterised protein [Chromobacterium violaceum]|nr:Uncharacterised protein [Chromobacterium violaceum]